LKEEADAEKVEMVGWAQGWEPPELLGMADFVGSGGVSERAGGLRDDRLGDLGIGRAGWGGVLGVEAPSEGGEGRGG
jgi:hypothetical protein